MYMQRYLAHFPAAGEVVIFDRSWYNRAGVEPVMGFCTEEEHERFLQDCPDFERYCIERGITLIKYWFDVGMEEQSRRFQGRMNDPRKLWKLSPMDVESYKRWYQYSRARDKMLDATDTDHAPWILCVRTTKKRALQLHQPSAELGSLRRFATRADRPGKRSMKGKYDDQAALEGRKFVPEKF